MKIQKLMNRNNIDSYDEYYKIVSNDDNTVEIEDFVNTLTTNTTEFFRENGHFIFLKKQVENIMTLIPRISKNSEIRIWCAASSTGQEPITLAIVLRDCLPKNIRIKILATDINSKVLKKAMQGDYSLAECDGLSKIHLLNHFTKTDDGYKAKPELLKLISYRYFNLMYEFNFKNGFDIIFCRNVMIYFNNSVQEELVNKFHDVLVPNGYLFIGHSESLINKKHTYRYVGPSIYMK